MTKKLIHQYILCRVECCNQPWLHYNLFSKVIFFSRFSFFKRNKLILTFMWFDESTCVTFWELQIRCKPEARRLKRSRMGGKLRATNSFTVTMFLCHLPAFSLEPPGRSQSSLWFDSKTDRAINADLICGDCPKINGRETKLKKETKSGKI